MLRRRTWERWYPYPNIDWWLGDISERWARGFQFRIRITNIVIGIEELSKYNNNDRNSKAYMQISACEWLNSNCNPVMYAFCLICKCKCSQIAEWEFVVALNERVFILYESTMWMRG